MLLILQIALGIVLGALLLAVLPHVLTPLLGVGAWILGGAISLGLLWANYVIAVMPGPELEANHKWLLNGTILLDFLIVFSVGMAIWETQATRRARRRAARNSEHDVADSKSSGPGVSGGSGQRGAS
jgi:hypothetical protein